MKQTVSLKENHMFRCIYAKGRRVVMPTCVVYVRRNQLGRNRLGITASGKLGNAVRRNKIRRRLREIYRTHERGFATGYDLILVARARGMNAPFQKLQRDLLRAARELGVYEDKL